MSYGTDSNSSLWAFVFFWGGICLFSLFRAIKSRSSSEKQEDNKKEDAADPVKQQYDHQSKENHDAGEYAYVLGQSYMDEDNNMAVKYFTEAIACGIEDANVFGLRGTCLHNLNRQHEAIKDYSKALELDPSDCNNYYMRAMAKIRAGDYIGFEDDMRLAINFARMSTPQNDVYKLGARQQGFSSVEALYKDTLEMLRDTINVKTSTVHQCAKHKRDTEAMANGQGAPDVSLRQLAREIRDMMNNFTSPEDAEAPRLVNAQKVLADRLKYVIEELQKVLNTDTPTNEKASRVVEETDEIKDLRRILRELREAYEAMPSVEAIRKVREMERARITANKRYHFWIKRVEDAKTGVYPESFKGTTEVEKDAEVASYKAKAEAARKEYWEIKKNSPKERLAVLTEKVTKVEVRLASLEKALFKNLEAEG